MDDLRVRCAISMAIDRDNIIKSIYRGRGGVAGFAFPDTPGATPYNELSAEAKANLTYNPQKARELLAEAGFADGFKLQVTTPTQFGSPWNEVAEALIPMFKDIGLDAFMDPIGKGEYNETVQIGVYPHIALAKSTGGWDRLGRAPAPHLQGQWSSTRSG